MSQTAQTYATHRKIVPLFHIALFSLLIINLVVATVQLLRFPCLDRGVDLMLAVAFLLMFLYIRVFPLRVQDRVIRLEMHQRLERILPAELRARIPELKIGQLIGLRFASDGELPELVREVLERGIADRDAIKQMVKEWQADHLRC